MLRRTRKLWLVVAGVTLVVALGVTIAGVATAGEGKSGDPAWRGHAKYTIGLFGDMPYNALGREQYPNLLANINGSDVAFSIYDGDLKAGADGPCSDRLYTTAIANFNTLERPLVWVPGDNDWTDCWGRYGPSTLPYADPIERLNHERRLFDATSQSLGEKTLTLTRESSEGGQYAEYSENVRWVYGPVVYLGLNVQGSNGNYPYHDTDAENPTGPVRSDAEIQRQRDEETARKAADIHWLAEGFRYARQIGAKGVLVDWQADPNFNNEQHVTNPHALGERDDRSEGPEPVRVQASNRPRERGLVNGETERRRQQRRRSSPRAAIAELGACVGRRAV